MSVSEIADLLQRINSAWLDGKPDELGPLLHPDIVMVFPGFSGKIQGRAPMVSGFVDFSENAHILSYEDFRRQIDVVGDSAVASFSFEMTYEREGARYRSTGRDLWMFARSGGEWLAVWRTMLEMYETPA